MKKHKDEDEQRDEEGQEYYENLVGINADNLKKQKIVVRKMQ